MARSPSELPTDREAQLMEVLWNQGPSTAEAVCKALPDAPHDSTVRTLLRILKEKGYVRIRGRQPAIYEPIVARTRVQSKATESLLARFFGGSVQELVQRLVEDEQLSSEQLEQLRKSLKQRKRKGG
jgi:BlaI family transcriptional regulator, penicillinase repressor